MAIIKNGILGGFSGKTGAVVGYELNGQNIMRGLPKERSKPYTIKELINQRKFAVSQAWLQPLTAFLRVGFQNYTPTFQGFTAAKSYNSKNALRGEDPDFYIDPELALVSFGDMSLAENANVLSETPGHLTFKWEPGDYKYDDRAMFLAYDIHGQKACFDTSAVRKSKGVGVLEAKLLSGTEVHAYLAFVSEDRKYRSKSQYLGKVMIG